MDQRQAAQILRRARAITAMFGFARPPVTLERAAARCGISEIRPVDRPGAPARLDAGAGGAVVLAIDSRIPPHTPQWNGVVALTMAQALMSPGMGVATADELAEVAAAELLLPARIFGPIAARTEAGPRSRWWSSIGEAGRCGPGNRRESIPDLRIEGRSPGAGSRLGVGGERAL